MVDEKSRREEFVYKTSMSCAITVQMGRLKACAVKDCSFRTRANALFCFTTEMHERNGDNEGLNEHLKPEIYMYIYTYILNCLFITLSY